MSGRSHDTRTQAVKSLPARPHSAGRRVREEPRHTFTGGQMPAGQTALGRSPCQGRAATHVHRRSNPCRRDRTRQVAVSGEEPRHTFTGGQIPAGQTALGRSPCQGGAATHVHRRSNPCRPDRTRQVAVSGRSRNTRTQAVKSLPARPHSAGRRVREEPRHTYTGGQIPAGLPRPHSAGRRVREEPRHTYTGGQIPAGQTTLGRSPCQGGAATQIDTHVANPVGRITLIKILQAHLS